jgi:LPXTG-site transpeptidase (sortase) family protein
VFDNLQKLHTGDKVYIEDDKGVTISFVVTQVKRYLPTAIVPEIFTSKDGKSHLNIITCD